MMSGARSVTRGYGILLAAVGAVTAGLVAASQFAFPLDRALRWLGSLPRLQGVMWMVGVLLLSLLVSFLVLALLLGLGHVRLWWPDMPAQGVSSASSGRPRPWYVNWAPWAWTLAVVLICGLVVTAEWSHPYCNDPVDGPAYAGLGLPLPFMRFSDVSSMEFLVMPTVYALDAFLIGAVVFPAVRWTTGRLARHGGLARVTSAAGLALALLAVSAQTLDAAVTWVPTWSIAPYGHGSRYHEYRPVGIASTYQYDCTPSEFWFGRAAKTRSAR